MIFQQWLNLLRSSNKSAGYTQLPLHSTRQIFTQSMPRQIDIYSQQAILRFLCIPPDRSLLRACLDRQIYLAGYTQLYLHSTRQILTQGMPRQREIYSQQAILSFICIPPDRSRAAIVHLNFRAGSTFPVPVCTVLSGHWVNKAVTQQDQPVQQG